MKVLLTLIVILSIAANIGFLTGCATFHDAIYGTPCKFSPDNHPAAPTNNGGKAELVRIANILDIKTSGKSVFDIARDIRYVLNRNAEIPSVFDEVAFEEMAKDLNTSEEKAMRDYQRFVSSLKGKRVIVIAPEE